MSEDSQAINVNNSSKSSRRKFKSRKRLVILIVVLVVVGGALYFGYRYKQAQKEIARLSNPTEAAKVVVNELVTKVSVLVEVPSDETPTVATVSDASKLRNQPFFANSENGDKVLIYPQARKAILYRPSTNKVITIAPVNIGDKEKTE